MNPRIWAAIEKADVACPCRDERYCNPMRRCRHSWHTVAFEEATVDCLWPGHALAEEVNTLEHNLSLLSEDCGRLRRELDDAKGTIR